MRTQQRIPVHFRAVFSLPQFTHTSCACVTGDMHGNGALLHVPGGVPASVQIGTAGRVRIEIAVDAPVEFNVDVRHIGSHRLGVCFLSE